jgi:hypothetical protein
LRLGLPVRALVAFSLSMPLLAAGDASAQSIFEKLFGLGERTPAPSAGAVMSRPLQLRPLPPEPRASEREAAANADDGKPGQTYQTMCVRTCDGYYWPVRYPATRGDFAQDAKMCESTCGAQAKLYTRSGPGAEAEEMRDSDGNSYGASKTAFAYRKGLVNGCTCRAMPWSGAERARHEGYALIEAEKAIRVAQAEAEKVAMAAVAVERAETEKRHAAMMAQVAAAEAKAVKDAGTAVVAGGDGPPVGPAEAAAIARFAEAAPVGDEPGDAGEVGARPGRERVKAQTSRQGQSAKAQRQRLPRGYVASGPMRVAPRYAATAQAPWWAQ